MLSRCSPRSTTKPRTPTIPTCWPLAARPTTSPDRRQCRHLQTSWTRLGRGARLPPRKLLAAGVLSVGGSTPPGHVGELLFRQAMPRGVRGRGPGRRRLRDRCGVAAAVAPLSADRPARRAAVACTITSLPTSSATPTATLPTTSSHGRDSRSGREPVARRVPDPDEDGGPHIKPRALSR
ncbi:hypothetical protein HBB16_21270 [Pseudonocardia sp. MCCB 268]|nr:hypothetical protein [Pseudonocardia cytotoxica]